MTGGQSIRIRHRADGMGSLLLGVQQVWPNEENYLGILMVLLGVRQGNRCQPKNKMKWIIFTAS